MSLQELNAIIIYLCFVQNLRNITQGFGLCSFRVLSVFPTKKATMQN